MTEITITIPGCPSRDLSPNASRHLHWSHKHRARQELSQSAYWAAREAIDGCHGRYRAPTGQVDVFTTIAWGKRRRFHDGDNALAMLKIGFDALTAAGVWQDDNKCRFHPVEQIRDKTGVGFVKVRVRS